MFHPGLAGTTEEQLLLRVERQEVSGPCLFGVSTPTEELMPPAKSLDTCHSLKLS